MLVNWHKVYLKSLDSVRTDFAQVVLAPCVHKGQRWKNEPYLSNSLFYESLQYSELMRYIPSGTSQLFIFEDQNVFPQHKTRTTKEIINTGSL